jgi:hypothetical protein
MQVGLMWYDDDPRKSLETKIEQAAARYCEKFGREPTACYVSTASGAAGGRRGGLRVVPLRTLRANYLWIGVDET